MSLKVKSKKANVLLPSICGIPTVCLVLNIVDKNMSQPWFLLLMRMCEHQQFYMSYGCIFYDGSTEKVS